MATKQPNPPTRREEDFPKTTTIPDGWIMDALMEVYNSTGSVADQKVAVLEQQTIPVPATGAYGKVHVMEADCHETQVSEPESLFTRRLDPFPSAWDLSGMWL